MKLFKVITKIPGAKHALRNMEFVDWYDAPDIESAKAQHAREAKESGLPDKYETVFVECNPETLKPIMPEALQQVQDENPGFNVQAMLDAGIITPKGKGQK